ncbi:hypothetical protein PPL_07330 [Heterostelium album PN500]|uniref:Terpene synthase n=1 Tax=Heterostelium pallidum (strain ATCC 26659 / Pp 5 / PN500) TaxID=670386 RepID=D3BF13_HETP5|nr:hypothetical protein PPL_07330 [Heterostelium album PN500]EFA80494.1 hypothetical protein PPL_07330 [Heterostelium album PN500]|eukprot:XP_020432614.1 hypothetical protein PPL_07330 [Heterostelium album PN500]
MEKFGIINDENREKYRPAFKGASFFARNIWSLADNQAIVLGTQFCIFAQIFDDLIDSNEPEYGIKIINRAINIFKLGKLEDDPTPLERNLRHNIGIEPGFYLGVIFTMKRLNPDILLDPLWKSLSDYTGKFAALYNDIFSYEKELREKDVRMNSFYFMKTQNNWSDKECFDFMDKELDNCFEQYFIHENLIIQKFIPTLQNKEDEEEFYKIVGRFHLMLTSLISLYLLKPSYKSQDSIFVELRI